MHSLERIVALLPWCSSVCLSVRLSVWGIASRGSKLYLRLICFSRYENSYWRYFKTWLHERCLGHADVIVIISPQFLKIYVGYLLVNEWWSSRRSIVGLEEVCLWCSSSLYLNDLCLLATASRGEVATAFAILCLVIHHSHQVTSYKLYMELNGLLWADVALRIYSLTHICNDWESGTLQFPRAWTTTGERSLTDYSEQFATCTTVTNLSQNAQAASKTYLFSTDGAKRRFT